MAPYDPLATCILSKIWFSKPALPWKCPASLPSTNVRAIQSKMALWRCYRMAIKQGRRKKEWANERMIELNRKIGFSLTVAGNSQSTRISRSKGVNNPRSTSLLIPRGVKMGRWLHQQRKKRIALLSDKIQSHPVPHPVSHPHRVPRPVTHPAKANLPSRKGCVRKQIKEPYITCDEFEDLSTGRRARGWFCITGRLFACGVHGHGEIDVVHASL